MRTKQEHRRFFYEKKTVGTRPSSLESRFELLKHDRDILMIKELLFYIRERQTQSNVNPKRSQLYLKEVIK